MMSKILPFANVLCAALVFFGYVNPTYTEKVLALTAQIDGYKGALSAAEQFKSREASLIEERDKIPSEGMKRVEAFLPDGVDNVQLILDLNSLATRSGVKLSSFDVEAPRTFGTSTAASSGSFQLNASQSKTDSITISLNAVGSYAALRTFMSSIEQSLRPLDLISFSLTNSETGVYNYHLVYRIYWLR